MSHNVVHLHGKSDLHDDINKQYLQWTSNPLNHLKSIPLVIHGYSITSIAPFDYLKIDYVFHEPFALRFDEMEKTLANFLEALYVNGYIRLDEPAKIATICAPISGMWKLIIKDENPKGWFALELVDNDTFNIHMWDGEDHYSFKFSKIP